MRSKVYFNGKPCVQAVATAMARAMHQNSEPLPPSYMPEGLLCAFIGSSDKGGKPNREVLDFINIIDPKRVNKAALYATSPGDGSKVIAAMKAALEARGIAVYEESFVCQGKGSLGGKMPSDQDLANAAAFVEKITSTL